MTAQRSVPAPFLTKTYQLVDDQSIDDVVSWNENGTAFVVWKTAEFAKDVLPNYFKHNNFSSFVRQLNTYGFHKVVPHKWEFANEHFRRGQKDLLLEIQRRKVIAGKSATPNSPPSCSNSATGDDLGSSSTASPCSKKPGFVETNAIAVEDLSDENEKLRRVNEALSLELAAAKRRRDELFAYLSEELNVEPDQIDRMVQRGTLGGSAGDDHDGNQAIKGERVGESLKLFGVWLKGEKKKRARDEKLGVNASHSNGGKNVEFHAPLLKSSKVCT